MATVQPKGDLIRKAVQWISNELLDHPEKKRHALVEQAAVKFNLSPMDAEYLQKLVSTKNG